MHRLRERENSNLGTSDIGDEEEEIERQICLVLLQSGVRRAMDLYTSVQRELPVLQWAQQQQQRGIDPADEARRRRLQAPVKPLVPGMPSNFRIVNERQREQWPTGDTSSDLWQYAMCLLSDERLSLEEAKHLGGMLYVSQVGVIHPVKALIAPVMRVWRETEDELRCLTKRVISF